METIAVYREKRIKTYGFQIQTKLCFIEIKASVEQTNEISDWFYGLSQYDVQYHFLLGQTLEQNKLRICCLLPKQRESEAVDLFYNSFSLSFNPNLNIYCPVDLLFFHGPHFGDRYGILEAAYQALNLNSIEMLAIGCSGASIYLVLNDGQAEKARKLLLEPFQIPGK